MYGAMVSVEFVILVDSVVNDDVGLGVKVVRCRRVILDVSLQSCPAKPSLQKHFTSEVHT